MGVVEGVKMELDDCAFPLLTSPTHTRSEAAPLKLHDCHSKILKGQPSYLHRACRALDTSSPSRYPRYKLQHDKWFSEWGLWDG